MFITDLVRSDIDGGRYYAGTIGTIGLGEFRADAPLELDEHGHDELQICVVLGGAMWERVGGRERRLEAGDIRISPPGDRHRIRFAGDDCRCLLVFVPETVLERSARSVIEQSRFLRAPGLRPTAQCLLAQLHHPDAASPLVAEAGALEVLAQSTRIWRNDVASGPPTWLRVVAAALDASAGSPPDLGTLAGRVGVHRVHLARAFRSHFGCSIGGYVRRLRLERARRLIMSTQLSLAAIAHRCGFADQSHMTRQVREALGRTPGAIRRHALRAPARG